MVPVFHLNLRPCALRSDGSAHFLPEARVVLLAAQDLHVRRVPLLCVAHAGVSAVRGVELQLQAQPHLVRALRVRRCQQAERLDARLQDSVYVRNGFVARARPWWSPW